MSSGTRPGCIIRRMRPADIETVLKIASDLNDAPHWPASSYAAALDRNQIPRRIALVAESQAGGEVIGFAIASALAPEAELESIVVRADRQRQGVGRVLLDELASELSAAAVTELQLEVRASNQAARNFYVSAGWRQTGTRPRYYTNPEDDAILMCLKPDA